jgi:hypothetical protein
MKSPLSLREALKNNGDRHQPHQPQEYDPGMPLHRRQGWREHEVFGSAWRRQSCLSTVS